MKDVYALSNTGWVRMLGRRFKTYRIKCRMTQREVSEQSGVSVPTVRAFENGRSANVSLQMLLALMRAVGQLEQVENIFPELPDNPKELFMNKQPAKRVRHGK